MRDKKFQKRLCMIVMLSISILFSLLTVQNEAVTQNTTSNTKSNQTTTNATTNKQTKNNTTTNNQTKTNTTTSSSSSANLSDLGITPHDFTGFKPNVTTYEVEVPENTKTIEVYAEAQSTKAKVTGIGNKELKKGDNKLDVVVTAQDGTQKTYTIHVIRGEKGTGTTTTEENGEGLAELKINNDLELTPEFKTNVYEYKVSYIGEDTKLNIETKPTSENYIIEVTGNENLQEGENIITILVSDSNGDNVATYQLVVNKSLIDEEAIAREQIEKRKQTQKMIMIGVGVVAFLAILFGMIRYRKNRNREEEFSRDYFYGNYEEDENDDEEEDDDDEIPKALRENRNKRAFIQEDESDEDREKAEKEKLKEEFLKNYSNKTDDDKETKQKGKRFK